MFVSIADGLKYVKQQNSKRLYSNKQFKKGKKKRYFQVDSNLNAIDSICL